MPEFLLEVGLEEIPARMIGAAEAELSKRVSDLLISQRLVREGEHVQARSFSTPRRLCTLVAGVQPKQPDITEQITGPAWGVAFKEGAPTPAASAFARKAGVEVAELARITTAKGEYVSATVNRVGRSARDILAEQLPKEVAALYWPKTMYWRPGKPERFVRPVRWILALLDDEVVPVEFAGIVASNLTYGHRILHGELPIAVDRPAEYLPKLESAYVLADVEARRHRIRKALDAVTRNIPQARWREDQELVDTVTHLTEWPSAITGGFEDEYLALPEEVLVTVMRDHQKYFAVETQTNGSKPKLAPHFLTVLNTEADVSGQAIIRHGNERVLRSRFSDAQFFWNTDQRLPLRDRVEMLKAVTFQKDLGSYYDKTARNRQLAEWLGDRAESRGAVVDRDALAEAATCAKTDLTTELVKEFTELQGIVGGLYAQAQGHGAAVSEAIYWQYSPASAEDPIPPTAEGQIFGLADRIDTLVQMFHLGLEPSGSKDPFALRRAGNAVVRILADSQLPLTLLDLRECAAVLCADASAEKVRLFLSERLESYLREQGGFGHHVVAAAMAANHDNVRDTIARANALTAMRGSADFEAICAAFKRVKNILKQAREKGIPYGDRPDAALLAEPGERALAGHFGDAQKEISSLVEEHRYREALEKIASLRPHVDAFFDAVMVMAPEADLRQNRLSLLSSIHQDFSRIADFGELAAG